MNRFLPIVAFAGLLVACNGPAKQAQLPNVYYGVGEFVKAQITTLSQRKPTVQKALDIAGKKEIQTTNAVNWNRELELFMQADINKPAFRNSYLISRPDSLTYQYQLKPGEKETVQSLQVRLDSVTRQPRQIRALLTTENPLYHSERHILLESGFDQRHHWQIQHYSMNGFQQLTFFDKNEFSVEGTVQ